MTSICAAFWCCPDWTGPNTDRIEQIGQAYLAKTRVLDERARAVGIATYEDGGLERVFRAMLSAPDWQNARASGIPALPGGAYTF